VPRSAAAAGTRHITSVNTTRRSAVTIVVLASFAHVILHKHVQKDCSYCNSLCECFFLTSARCQTTFASHMVAGIECLTFPISAVAVVLKLVVLGARVDGI
jgi:hypothetical protein